MTKRKRHRIYKLAKEYYLEGHDWCMCHAIDSAFAELYFNKWRGWWDYYSIFPEFYALKPKGKTFNIYWWKVEWDDRTNDIRSKKFDQIIEATK